MHLFSHLRAGTQPDSHRGISWPGRIGRGLTAVLLALTLVVTASPSPAAASDGWPSRAAMLRMQAAMDAMVADGTPGMYVQIRQGSRVTELRSGRPDLNSERPWTDRSRFRVASVTKTFVAAVIMQLVGEGRLRLSDGVERWLPGQLPYGRQITIRQLLNHTAGLPAYESRTVTRAITTARTEICRGT